MPNSLDASSSIMQIFSVAKLMRLCGVSVDMNYGVNGSGAVTMKVPNALVNNFDYSSNVTFAMKDDYTNTTWQNILKNELNSGRPILYAGTDPNSGGHAFVCDGFDNSNKFHFNWGWAGNADGYYFLSALAPGDNYTTNQQAVIGIEPAHPVAQTAYDLVMNATLSTDASTYSFGEDVIATSSIKNSGTGTFSGYIKIMLCDMSDNIVDYRLNYVTIPANGVKTNSVTFYGYAPLVPGEYYITALSMTDKDDINTMQLVRDDASHQNFALIEVQYGTSIEAYSTFSTSVLYAGQTATVSVKLKNDDNSAFTGTVALAIADLSGNIEQYIGQKSISNLSANGTYTLSLSSTLSVTAGEHFLMLIFKPSGSSSWYYAGSSYYSNPVRIYVQGQPSPDMYEADNSVATAYNLGTMSLDYECFDIDANFHNSSDKDYYKISLPTGYEYEFKAAIYDSYNIGSSMFSVDGVFAVSKDGVNWSNDYDNILDSLTVLGDSVLYFRVLPYTSGDIGTYRMTINVFRWETILPDKYEENDSEMSAYTLATVNSASQTITADANFHIESDEDFYKIILPAGYDYKVNAIIYTSYNSTTYTADAKFATSTDGVSWSNNYGTQMPEMSLSGSAVLFFRVLPYTIGELGTYQLKIQVQRTQSTPSINPDQYENNNSVATAYTLTTVNNNSAQVSAVATFHVTSDVDFYKVVLPAGYDYTVNATLYSKANSTSYTAQASFATSTNGGSAWAGDYVTQMPEMTVSNGGTVYFRVALNSDDPGTYKLAISVQRKSLVGIGETDNLAEWTVYPNPATDVLNISVPDCLETERIDLLNIDGKLVHSYMGDVKLLNIGDLSSGVYFVRIVTEQGFVIRKWVK
ncbi:MAG: C10 family peptidase [Bacteroidales bacterium]|nr:C10 family peptidase [Bacteroidales bacterium]